MRLGGHHDARASGSNVAEAGTVGPHYRGRDGLTPVASRDVLLDRAAAVRVETAVGERRKRFTVRTIFAHSAARMSGAAAKHPVERPVAVGAHLIFLSGDLLPPL